MFLLISSLVQHKASRLVSSYQVAMQRVYEYFVHLNTKRRAYREWKARNVKFRVRI